MMTNETKHTPGPWDFDDLRSDGGNLEIVGGNDVCVADVDPDGSDDEVMANARLIAAAPDLLAACARWVSEAEKFASVNGFNLNDTGTAYAQVKAAIAKAVQPCL